MFLAPGFDLRPLCRGCHTLSRQGRELSVQIMGRIINQFQGFRDEGVIQQEASIVNRPIFKKERLLSVRQGWKPALNHPGHFTVLLAIVEQFHQISIAFKVAGFIQLGRLARLRQF